MSKNKISSRGAAFRCALFMSTALAAFLPHTAAADFIITTSRTTPAPLDILNPTGGTVTINSGVSISPGFFSLNVRHDVVNSGTISNPNGLSAALLRAGGSLTNNQGATISTTAGNDNFAVTVIGGTTNNFVTNSGTINGSVELTSVLPQMTTSILTGVQGQTFTNNATGVVNGTVEINGGTTSTLVNAGRITGGVLLAQDSPDPDPLTQQSNIVVATTKTMTNTSTGVISGPVLLGRGNIRNVSLNGTTYLFDVVSQGTLTNAGAINGFVVAENVTNTGTITVAAGNIALISYGNATPLGTTLASLTGSLNNSGTVNGHVSMRSVTNSGTINGNLLFGNEAGFVLPVDDPAIIGGVITQRATVSGTLVNSGTINGLITMSAGSTATNSGTIGFGTAFGTSNINGDFTQTSTGRLIIKANEAGQSDRLVIQGRAVLAGSLSVAAVDGAWNTIQTYNIISATGGVSGQFSDVALNLTYLTPSVEYTANNVNLKLFRRTADIQQDIVSETSDQQTSVAARKTTQTIDARIDDAVTASLINLDAITTPTNDADQASAGNIISKSAGDDVAGWGVWATVTPTFLDQSLVLPNSPNPQQVEGTVWDVFVGADRVIGSNAVAGMFAGYEDSNFDLGATGGERKATGPMVGAYSGLVFTDWLYGSVQANHVWFDNDLSETSFGGAPVRGEFDSKRYAVSTGLTAHTTFDKLRVQGKIGYSYTKEKFDAYTASDGAAVGAFKSRLGRMTISTELSYLGDGFTPYATAAFERDVQAPAGGGDDEGGVLGLGGRYKNGAFSLDFYGNIEVARAAEKAATLGLNARFAF